MIEEISTSIILNQYPNKKFNSNPASSAVLDQIFHYDSRRKAIFQEKNSQPIILYSTYRRMLQYFPFSNTQRNERIYEKIKSKTFPPENESFEAKKDRLSKTDHADLN